MHIGSDGDLGTQERVNCLSLRELADWSEHFRDGDGMWWQGGEVLLLENVRFHKEEEKNDIEFSKQLAKGIDCFVNDAFGTAHRAHASTAGIADYVSIRVAGFLLEKELAYLSSVIQRPKKPFVAIVSSTTSSHLFLSMEQWLSPTIVLELGDHENCMHCILHLELFFALFCPFLPSSGHCLFICNFLLHTRKCVGLFFGKVGVYFGLCYKHLDAPQGFLLIFSH